MNKLVKNILLCLTIVFLAACALPAVKNQTSEDLTGQQTVNTENAEKPAEKELPKEGLLTISITDISITDKALSLGNITSVKLKVLSASAYHKEKAFWTTISDADTVFDLFELKKKSIEQVYGNKSLPEGDYSMLKLKIADVKVTRNNKEEDAFLPSGELKIQMPFKIEAELQTKITIDFIADDSLHMTSDGKIIFAPVLHARSGRQEISVGMNEKGELGAERMDRKKDFTIQNNKIVLKPTTMDEKFAALHESVVELGEGEKKTVVVQDENN
ncbi:MAG: DUF4382 domain-containing protein [Candidatus Aenigmarchaeota archaeon]|nr:DUF4382 domain-containing protein [Candidatus Aenigmarchaeota archaeon]